MLKSKLPLPDQASSSFSSTIPSMPILIKRTSSSSIVLSESPEKKAEAAFEDLIGSPPSDKRKPRFMI